MRLGLIHLIPGFYRYGLGTCYMRMSKLRLADYHFQKASQIHPQNAVLLGCVGVVSSGHASIRVRITLLTVPL